MSRPALLVYAPLRVEAAAVRGALPGARLVRTGMGPERARIAAAAHPPGGDEAVGVVGCCGGVGSGLRPGDVVVATEVRGPLGLVASCPTAGPLADALRARGLRVHLGPVLSTTRVQHGRQRAAARAAGAVAVDMESAWLAAPGRPFVVVRAVTDTDAAPLLRPGVVPAGLAALRSLRVAAGALIAWSAWCRETAGPVRSSTYHTAQEVS